MYVKLSGETVYLWCAVDHEIGFGGSIEAALRAPGPSVIVQLALANVTGSSK